MVTIVIKQLVEYNYYKMLTVVRIFSRLFYNNLEISTFDSPKYKQDIISYQKLPSKSIIGVLF